MKFEIKNLKEGGYELYKKSDDRLFVLGDIFLFKENMKNCIVIFQILCYNEVKQT